MVVVASSSSGSPSTAGTVYVLDGETCTKWNRKSFARKGEPTGESEPGECGYSDDGKVFFGGAVWERAK